jgi:ABC-type multidrug transport system ATPase subunit
MSYGDDSWALKNYSLELDTGVVGLLGPNGAGKSTLMRILATVSQPTEGSVLWNGDDISESPDSLRATLGYLPQDFGIYPNLSAIEFLEYLAALKGLPKQEAGQRINELLDLLGLAANKKQPLSSFSGGMRQRVGIAQALLNDPKILIVDEPTVGLDPSQRARFRDLISGLSEDRLVILSTHIVSDIEAIATRIVIMESGRLITDDSPEGVLQDVEGKVWSYVAPSSELGEISARTLVSSAIRRPDGVHLRVVASEMPDQSAEQVLPNLEDAYLFHTSNSSVSVG